MMEIVNGPKTTNNSKSTDEHKKKQYLIRLSPSLHQSRVRATVVPVSFMTLPILIDELWKTFKDIGGEKFKNNDCLENKDIFKKVMLTLAEAKVCCAQLACPHKLDLPQKDLYFHQELLDLNLLAKKLPYPLALYLDCLGNTMEGELNVTPVLAEMEDFTDYAGAISGGPRQIPPLLHLLCKGPVYSDSLELMNELKALPGFNKIIEICKLKSCTGLKGKMNFWLTPDGIVEISDDEIKVFQQIVNCFDDANFNTGTDLFAGQGTMAQTVQTPKWYLNGRFRYFCMTDISEHDQKLGALFGFSFNHGRKIQSSRYGGSFEAALWQGEVVPQKMLKSMLDENSM